MKTCPECHQDVDETLEYCDKCGYHFTENDLETQIRETEAAAIAAEEQAKALKAELEKKKEEARKHQQEEKQLETDVPEVAEVCENTEKTDSEEGSYQTLSDKVDSDVASSMPKKKKFVRNVILLALIPVLVIILLFALNGRSDAKTSDDYSVSANIDDEGNAYFTTKTGIISFKGNMKYGKSTPDQKHFVLLEQDGNLYYYSSKDAEKQRIASDVSGISIVQSNGCIFITKEAVTVEEVLKQLAKDYGGVSYADVKEIFEENYKGKTAEDAEEFYALIMEEQFPGSDICSQAYCFSNKKTVSFGSCEYISAPDSLTSAVRMEDDLMIYQEGAEKLERMCGIEEDANLVGIAADGKQVICTRENNGNTNVYSYTSDDKEKLGSLGETPKYGTPNAEFFNGGEGLIVSGSNFSSVVIINKGVSQTVKFKGEKSYNMIMNEKGEYVSRSKTVDKGFYIEVETEDFTSDLYYVDLEGNKEKVLSDIQKIFGIRNTRICYMDDESDLYVGFIAGGLVKDEERITSEVTMANLSEDGRYIYLEKDNSLYYVDLVKGDKKPHKITEDIHREYLTTEGKTIYYISDPIEVEKYVNMGTLYKYTVGGEAEKIADDIVSLAYTGKDFTTVDINFIVAFKYSATKNDETYYQMGSIEEGKFIEIDDGFTSRY